MGRPKGSTKKGPPSYLKHSATGKPYVMMAGKPVYLGTRQEYDSPQSWQRYYALIAENNLRGGQGAGDAHRFDKTVTELIAGYWTRANNRDLSKGTRTKIRQSLRFVQEVYGELCASDYSPLKHRAVLDRIIERGGRRGQPLCRTTVQLHKQTIEQAFCWGESIEMVKPGVTDALRKVESVAPGTPKTTEPTERLPVPIDDVNATLPFMPPIYRDVVRLLLLTGARPSEVLSMRAVDIKTTSQPWEYRPAKHKTMKKGKSRVILLDGECQQIIAKYLTPDLAAHFFKSDVADLQSTNTNVEERLRAIWLHLAERLGVDQDVRMADLLGNWPASSQGVVRRDRTKAARPGATPRYRTPLAVQMERRVREMVNCSMVRRSKLRTFHAPTIYRLLPPEQWTERNPQEVARVTGKPEFAGMHVSSNVLAKCINQAIQRMQHQQRGLHKLYKLPGEPKVTPVWTPYQCRHTYLTLIANRYGQDVTQRLAGHSDPKMTLRYTTTAYALAAAAVLDFEQKRKVEQAVTRPAMAISGA